uniref:Uncharacterized protein n=1 Tax=Oryza barthii TaxID=65489 RepID=A0A0D3EX68_9ORYZ
MAAAAAWMRWQGHTSWDGGESSQGTESRRRIKNYYLHFIICECALSLACFFPMTRSASDTCVTLTRSLSNSEPKPHAGRYKPQLIGLKRQPTILEKLRRKRA